MENNGYDDNITNNTNEGELNNNNQGQRTDGSNQSTSNTPPYPQEGDTTTNGEKSMQHASGVVNQWSEAGNPNNGDGLIVPGLPPTEMSTSDMLNITSPNGPPGQQEMPGGMPPGGGTSMPPGVGNPNNPEAALSPQIDPQLLQLINDTVRNELNNYHNKVTKPIKENLDNTIHHRTIAIRDISTKLQKSISSNDSMKLNIDHLKNNASAKFREIEPSMQSSIHSSIPLSMQQNNNNQTLNEARNEISKMCTILDNNPTSILR